VANRSQGKDLLFWGDQELGEPEPEGRREAKQKIRRPPGAGIGPKLCPGPRTEQKKCHVDRNNRIEKIG
jgi:hypothetical protein